MTTLSSTSRQDMSSARWQDEHHIDSTMTSFFISITTSMALVISTSTPSAQRCRWHRCWQPVVAVASRRGNRGLQCKSAPQVTSYKKQMQRKSSSVITSQSLSDDSAVLFRMKLVNFVHICIPWLVPPWGPLWFLTPLRGCRQVDVRCMIAQWRGYRRHVNTVSTIMSSAGRHGNHIIIATYSAFYPQPRMTASDLLCHQLDRCVRC